ncbi:2,3-bisphosphoglycerate-independent phosphoglycerate mutase [Kushneria phosphatilytica]|uniref:2,3-bisphosphoglycerate-independent phosphoglycerate mutase n=1 Tax=Kushneria phosphatilytica TaxID=657387 RepID=A0A5C0ZVV5_9GAMM|nr:2,3-bisphosphoglycerate-independent phosphoglycerate mutase [Kushneria phosphatilytica]QEL09707.1 2,3-bisphosphoglycerate-independent phosphoglycerate mutase [Kushneria phosphatilytica]
MSQERTDRPRPVALIILDGYGRNPNTDDNAVALANTPVMDRLLSERPHTLIHTDGGHVGLPEGQMGNSEVGHMNIGAGRVVFQSLTRISNAISDGELADNTALTGAIDAAIERGRAVHLLGLLSPGGVHSHEDHILALAELAAARGAKRVYIHAFLDGRDTPPQSAHESLVRADEKLQQLGVGHVASMVGRFYAMDRDNRWERVEQAWRVVVDGQGTHTATTAEAGLEAAYERGETDEFVEATSLRPEDAPVTIEDGDAVLFANFRADRARELARVFVDNDFDGFARERRPQVDFVMMTQYSDGLDAPVAFPPQDLPNTLGEFTSARGLTQLRIAETEKYAHVTFFFSGGREEPFEGEERILVNSPKDVKTYDEKPEMSAGEVTDRLVEAIDSGRFDLVICNYANCDMVGHTGDLQAAIGAVEAVDTGLGRVLEAIERAGGSALVTADHGNAEQMVDPETGKPHTAHTTFLVPLVYVGQRPAQLRDHGRLCDLAPSLLSMMGEQPPQEMTGHSLVDFS